MEFDPLDLFTPQAGSGVSCRISPDFSAKISVSHAEGGNAGADQSAAGAGSDALSDSDSDSDLPLHVHDLPLLRQNPPSEVLVTTLRLLSPQTTLNFEGALETEPTDIGSPEAVFAEKEVSDIVPAALPWLTTHCPYLCTRRRLATFSLQAQTFKAAFSAQYNAWLTGIIASPLHWCGESAAEIQKLAPLRLAENCGRTAQPEMIRRIVIPNLDEIRLKEPSLTADNLGLKTWGSSFVLGCRLAANPGYLSGSVLELGSGTGLVGLVACRLGFAAVLTDLPEITPNLADNVQLNAIPGAMVADLDWSNPAPFLETHSEKYTTLILSDPLYSSKHPQWIVDMVDLFLEPSPEARVLLQIPIRRTFENERARLWQLMDVRYKVAEEVVEEGFDDFGHTQFIFKKYIRK